MSGINYYSPSAQGGPAPRLQYRWLGWALAVAGGIVLVLGTAAIAVVLPLSSEEPDAVAYLLKLPAFLRDILISVLRNIPDDTPFIGLMLPGMFLWVAGIYLIKYARRHLAPMLKVGDVNNLAHCILYLRPFSADKAGVWGQPKFFFGFASKRVRAWAVLGVLGITRWEELMAYAFSRVGNLVTIGSPVDKLPLLGAQRVYASEETWKGEVQRLAARADLILHHVGSTRGVRWEIEHIVAACDPLRTVLCVNPTGKLTVVERVFRSARRKRIRNTWAEFRKECSVVFPCGLPEEIGDALFIRFDQSWNAIPIRQQWPKVAWFWPGKNPDSSRKSIDSALQWMSWLLGTETTVREFARNFINVASFIAAIFVTIWLVASAASLLS